MALIGHSDRGHGFQKLVLLLIISLTIFGNALEFCRILPSSAECSDRVKALVGIGGVSSVIVLIVLVAKAADLGAAGAIELLGSVLTLGLWVAAAALVTSAKTMAVVGGADSLWGSPAFFASWGGALVALSLTLRAVCDSPMVENLGLKKRRSAVARSADAEPAEKSLDVANSDGVAAAAEYA